MLAHIAGIPVEETALSFAPVAVAAGGVAGARLRRLARRRNGREALAMREESAPRGPREGRAR
jgi:hypothetical protein